MVGDDLTGVQRPDDLDALEQALLTLGLGWPPLAGDVLVDRLPRSERHPEPSRKHGGEGGRGLGDDRGVVALPRGVDDPHRQRRRRQRRSEPRPGEPAVPLPRAPRCEVVRAHGRLEPHLLGALHSLQEVCGVVLFVGRVEADDRHASVLPGGAPAETRRVGFGGMDEILEVDLLRFERGDAAGRSRRGRRRPPQPRHRVRVHEPRPSRGRDRRGLRQAGRVLLAGPGHQGEVHRAGVAWPDGVHRSPRGDGRVGGGARLEGDAQLERRATGRATPCGASTPTATWTRSCPRRRYQGSPTC